jgi:hypothetical protein
LGSVARVALIETKWDAKSVIWYAPVSPIAYLGRQDTNRLIQMYVSQSVQRGLKKEEIKGQEDGNRLSQLLHNLDTRLY